MPYLFYLSGIVLLVLPTSFISGHRFAFRTLEEIAEERRYRFGWIHGANAIDACRAFAGVSLLQAAFALYSPAGIGAWVSQGMILLASLAGVLMQQTFQKVPPYELAAPLAYLLGLGIGLSSPVIVLLVLPLAVASSIAWRNVGVGLVLLAIGTGVLGRLLGGSLVHTASASLVFVLPVLVATILQRRLVLTVRRRTRVYKADPLREVTVLASR